MDAAREREYNHHKFMAALKGIDLGDNKAAEDEEGYSVEQVKKRLAAKVAGVPEEVVELDGMFGFEEDEEEE